MEEAQEEKHESNQCNENFSTSVEQKDRRKSHTRQNFDESEEKLRTSAGMKEDEQDNNELEGDPKESCPISASDGGVTHKKFDCKVCGKEFRSIKAVHGHMRVHSGRKRAAKVGSNGGEEEWSYSLRTKKHASIKFKPPRTPHYGTPQNPVSNGGSHVGEASSSSPMETERSSSEREIEVSHPWLIQAPENHPHDPKESCPISASYDGVTHKKFDCKVCGKEFRSIKAVHGHMRVHSGKKRAAEVGSNGGEEEWWYSLDTKKHASIKFKPSRTPHSGTPQNTVSNGGSHVGEAWSSSPTERERSRSERQIDVSHPGFVLAPEYHPEHDSIDAGKRPQSQRFGSSK